MEKDTYKRRGGRGPCRKGYGMIPQDPVMLLSFINLKLRDFYRDLDSCCEDMDISRSELEGKLAEIGYRYDEERNRFV